MKIGYFGLLFLYFLTCDILTSSLVAGGRKVYCYLKPDPGPCRGYFPRYFYNVTSGYCELFIYGGCGGNANNFEYLEDCQQNCVCNLCLLQADPGNCYGYFPRYFYNVSYYECQLFTYGGCGGNANNFMTYHACDYTCNSPWTKGSTKESTREEKEINQV